MPRRILPSSLFSFPITGHALFQAEEIDSTCEPHYIGENHMA